MPPDALDIDLVRLARFAGTRVILGRADGIDRARRRVHVAGRGEIAYDIASIDIGISSDLPHLPGFAEHEVAEKPLGPYAAQWRAFREAVAEGAVRPEIAVIGAGVGGVELSMAMAHALRDAAPRIRVLEKDRALADLAPATREALTRQMQRHGVTLREGVEVARVEAGAVVLAGGERVPSLFTVGTTGARPFGWLGETGLDLTQGL
jgi:NADH dehydrogenase, FAD-containing subunit